MIMLLLAVKIRMISFHVVGIEPAAIKETHSSAWNVTVQPIHKPFHHSDRGIGRDTRRISQRGVGSAMVVMTMVAIDTWVVAACLSCWRREEERPYVSVAAMMQGTNRHGRPIDAGWRAEEN